MKRRKILSITICVCLLICMFPQLAFAAEADPQANQQTEPVISTDAAEPQKAPAQVTDPPESPMPQAEPTTADDKGGEPQGTVQNQSTSEQESSAAAPSDSPTESPQPEPASVESSNAFSQSQASTPAAEQETSAASLTTKKAAAPMEGAPKEQAGAAKSKTIATVKKTAAGVTVSGGIEGKDWVYDSSQQTLVIQKDGITVSGTATDDLAILCTMAVTAITIDNLDHGSNVIALMSADENGNSLTDLTIKIQGENRIDAIVGMGDITLVGTKNSRLDLTLGAMAFQDLNFKNAVVNGGSFMAIRDLNIKGKSVVTAKFNKYLSPGDTAAMIFAGRDLNIDLAKGGKVTADGYAGSSKYHYQDRTFPLLAGRSINISKGSHVSTPSGGKVGTYYDEGLSLQAILNADGSPAVDASVQYGTDKSLTASASVSDISSSPQTGDYGAGLVFLYIVLLAAGAAALISRRKTE